MADWYHTPGLGEGTQEGRPGRSSGPGVNSLGTGHASGNVTGEWGVRQTAVDVDRIIGLLSMLGPEVIAAAAKAAEEEGKREFKITQHLVPIYEGELQKSGRVESVDIMADTLEVGIAYGGEAGVARNTRDVDYALIVHEDLEAHHLFGRRAKYVESVVRGEYESGRANAFMAPIIRREMGWE